MVLSPLLSLYLVFTQASQRHHHRQYHHVILSEHLHRRCTFAPRHGFRSIPSETLSTQAQAPHTTSSTYTERLWPPKNGESKPLASNDSSDVQGGEDTNQTTTIETEVESSEGSREVPRSQAASPRHTNTEQVLARVNLEKALWMQARRKCFSA